MAFRSNRPDKSAAHHRIIGEYRHRSQRGALRHGAGSRRVGLQDRSCAVSNLGPGCLSRGSHSGYRLSFGRIESCWFCRVAARVASISDAPRDTPITRFDRDLDLDLRKPGCAAARQLKTATRVFEHRARRLFADRRLVLGWPPGYLLSRCLFTNDALELCRPRDRIAADRRSDLGLRWIREAVAISRLCHADCNGLARRRAIHGRISREGFHLLRRHRPAPNRAARRGCDYCGLWFLLLPQSCPRDVLAVYRQDGQDPNQRAVALCDERADSCDHRARRLSAADSGCVKTLKSYKRYKVTKNSPI